MKRKLAVCAAVLLLAALPCLLCGCVPADAESAFKKMQRAGFDAALVTRGLVGQFLDFTNDPQRIGDIEAMLVVGNVLNGDFDFMAMYFKDRDTAGKAYADLTAETGEGEVIRVRGKCVYFILGEGGRAALNTFEGF